MKMILSTTALMVALAAPTMTLAQSTAAASNVETQQHGAQMPGFLNVRDQSDLFASELLGLNVYAWRNGSDMHASGDRMNTNGTGMRHMAMMSRADLDAMETIGQINEIVLSNDGQVRALVIGVGGFLGMGEHVVAVTMDQITIASDADESAQIYVVVNARADMLSEAPAYDQMAAHNNSAMGNDETRPTRSPFAELQIAREGYIQLEVTEVSPQLLMGRTVYDMNENNVGDVTNMILDNEGSITEVVIDFGGFLGMGSSQIAIGYDAMTILTNEGYEDVRLYVNATKEQIQRMPQYSAGN